MKYFPPITQGGFSTSKTCLLNVKMIIKHIPQTRKYFRFSRITNKLRDAESFLRSRQLLSQTRNSTHIMVSKVVLLCSQQPLTPPYHTPNDSRSPLHIQFPMHHFNIILSPMLISPQLPLHHASRHAKIFCGLIIHTNYVDPHQPKCNVFLRSSEFEH